MKPNHAFTSGSLALGCLLAVVPAQSTTITYTYQGNNFTEADVPVVGTITGTDTITTSDAIGGSFTVNVALPANWNSQEIQPGIAPYLLSVAFTDGAGDTAPTNLRDSLILVSTNSMGQITSWKVYEETDDVVLSTCSGADEACGMMPPADTPENSEDFAAIFGALNGVDAENNGFAYNDPGTWTESIAWTPEPPSFWLLATGMLMLGCFAMRNAHTHRFRQSSGRFDE